MACMPLQAIYITENSRKFCPIGSTQGQGQLPHPLAAHLHLCLDEAHFLLQHHLFPQQPLHDLQLFPALQGLDLGALRVGNGPLWVWPSL